jgi:Ca2+-binding EF-hand superfamily protein
MRAKTLYLALAVSAASSVAVAQTAFDAYDVDESGAVERQEFLGAIDDIGTFRQWDTDGNGKISEDEFRDIGLDGDFIDWDTNQDTNLDENEFYTGTFDTYDQDQSGIWEDNEWDDADDAGLLDI